MPSPFRNFGHKLKDLFQSRSKDMETSTTHRNTDRFGAVEGRIGSSSAPPSTIAGLVSPIVVVTPTLPTVDLNHDEDSNKTQGTGRCEPPIAHPFVDPSGHRTPSRRSSFKAPTAQGPRSPSPHWPGGPLDMANEDHEEARGLLSVAPSLSPSSSTNYFPNSRDFSVGNMNISNTYAYSKSLFEYLNPHIAHGAAHNSDERWNAPACHEETRVAIREDIVSWIEHGEEDEEPKKIMWLSGPAGSGKTAIAGSVAETCKGSGLLAATFFFSSFAGSAERSSKRGLIPTLAHHMSQHDTLYEYKAHLHLAVDRHPDIFRKNLREQAERLILQPFQSIHNSEASATWPKVVVIDGLDEVVAAKEQQTPGTSEDDQVEILNVLLALSRCPAFPFRIFVASRPETQITEFFATTAQASSINLFLDSKYNPDADVERFLVSKFAHIRRRSGISEPWPEQPILDRLVDMSSGQFIVPSTIIRWVESGLPEEQLEQVLRLEWTGTGGKNPFAAVDVLYRHILKRAHNPDNDPHRIVNWILSINSAVSGSAGRPPATFWRQFLEDKQGELNYRLAPIASLISIPPPGDTSSPVTFYHKSLTDFLSSSARCGDLFVSERDNKAFVAHRILRVLKDKRSVIDRDCPQFVDILLWLNLFTPNFKKGGGDCIGFLDFLSDDAKADLDTCDVAWLATAYLSDDQNLRRPWVAQGIYCWIHRVVGCNSNAPAKAENSTRQTPDLACHPTCVRWRTVILDSAKELGWCVHEMEEVKLDKLQNLSQEEVGSKFAKVGWKRWRDGERHIVPPCSICQPINSI